MITDLIRGAAGEARHARSVETRTGRFETEYLAVWACRRVGSVRAAETSGCRQPPPTLRLCPWRRGGARPGVIVPRVRVRRARLPWIVLLTLALLTVVPLAQASPPDPTWLGGVYDGADLDDVVQFLVTAVAVPVGERPVLIPTREFRVLLLPAVPAAVPALPRLADRSRAPPAP